MKRPLRVSNIIEAPFTEEMVDSAKEKAKSLGKIKNSILKGKGNFAGYLGEEIVASYIKADIISSDKGEEKYNHDLVLDGRTIEVKTKRRTVPPKDFYDASVAHTSLHRFDERDGSRDSAMICHGAGTVSKF